MHEVPAPAPRQPQAEEGPHRAHRRLLRGGPLPLRPARRHPRRLQPGHRRGGSGPPRGDQQGIGLIQPLPLPYLERIRRVPGREGRDLRQRGSGGSTRTRRTSSPQFAIDPESWRAMYPEFRIDRGRVARLPGRPAGRRRRRASSPSASAGRSATTSRSRAPAYFGGGNWEFNVRGDLPRARGPRTTTAQFWFQHKYFDENGPEYWQGHRRLVRGAGRAIRTQALGWRRPSTTEFANSTSETRTQTETAFAAVLREADGQHRVPHPGHRRRSSSSPCCSSPGTPWRSRCASGRASWRC